MATQAQAANDESPADSDDTEVADALEDADETESEETVEDEPPEDEEEAAARAAKEAEEGKDEEKPDEEAPATAKALKDMTPDELSAALTPEQQMRIAHKFANKTMAAARRAEKATGDVKAANEKLTGEIATYRGFVDQFQSDPMSALRRLPGFTTLKDFVQRCVAGGTSVETKPQDEIAALRKRLDEKEAREAQQRQIEATRASQTRVFEALATEPERFGRVLTRLGRPQLWASIAEYTRTHGGKCPNIKVYELADELEAELKADGIVVSKGSAGPAQKGTPAAAKAQSAASKPGKPTGKPSTATSAKRTNEADETEDEREARIIREMREAGELTE